ALTVARSVKRRERVRMNWVLLGSCLALTILLVLAPGPIVTLVIATGANQGVRAALVTVAGTTTGNALLLAAIASGLGFVVSHAAPVFEVLRWAGAAYLMFLGIQTWRRAGAARLEPPPHRALFRRGALVALSNPKTIAFFTAFLPQFVDPTLPAWRQLGVMCAASVAIAAVGFGLGSGRRPWPSLAREAELGAATGALIRCGSDRGWHLAVAGTPTRLTGESTPNHSLIARSSSEVARS